MRAWELHWTKSPLIQSPQLAQPDEAPMRCLLARPVPAETLTGAATDPAEAQNTSFGAKVLGQALSRALILWQGLREEDMGGQLVIVGHDMAQICLPFPAPIPQFLNGTRTWTSCS